jgi:hypothetical protein
MCNPRSPGTVLAVVVLLPVLAVPLGARAGTPTDVAEERTKKRLLERTPGQDAPLTLAAELGTALSRGNTETLHLHADAKVAWVPATRWVSTTAGHALYEQAKKVEVANAWSLLERVDRFVSERFSVFVAAGVDRNVFAGIERRESAQLGVSFLAIDRRDPARGDLVTDRLEFELGGYGALEHRIVAPDAAPGTVLDDPEIAIVASRAAAAYLHAFEKGTEVGVSVEEIEDFVDLGNRVIGANAYAAAALVDGLSIKLSITDRFDNVPATPELKKNDLLFTGGVVVSL